MEIKWPIVIEHSLQPCVGLCVSLCLSVRCIVDTVQDDRSDRSRDGAGS